MPSRRTVLAVVASGLLSGCAGAFGTGGGRGADRPTEAAVVRTNDTVAVRENETGFERPAVTTPDTGNCSPASRPSPTDGVAYPDHPDDLAELSALRFARRHETALAANRVAVERPDATLVDADAVDAELTAPGTDDWYVVAVTVELTTRSSGAEATERVGGTYYLTDDVSLRAESAADSSAVDDSDAPVDLSAAVVVACR